MSSEIDICNLALSNIGDEAAVTSISPPDGSAQAGHCARFYPIARDTLQDMATWGFCSARATLALLSAPPDFGWQYSYAVPANAINIIAVLGSGAQTDDDPKEFVTETLVDGTQVILTNEPNALVRYSVRVIDTSAFPPTFVVALSWLLASYLSGPIIKGESGRTEAKACKKEFEYWLTKAAESDANQNRRRPIHTPQWIADRGLSPSQTSSWQY